MIVDIDVGNTRVKWRVCGDQSKVLGRGWCLTNEGAIGEFLDDLKGEPTRFRVASVAGARVMGRLQRKIEERWGIQPEFAVTAENQCGVVNSYSVPSRMGVDRWLAMLAAFHRVGDGVCVVDCGSALTLDLVAADGRHLGGYITPGLRLIENSIVTNTERVNLKEPASPPGLGPGRSTEQAVNNGLLLMLVGAIEKALEQFAKLEKGFTIYLTGGDAELMASMLSVDVNLEQDLVLDGLRLALP